MPTYKNTGFVKQNLNFENARLARLSTYLKTSFQGLIRIVKSKNIIYTIH